MTISIKDSSILNYIIVLYVFFIPLSLNMIRILAPLIIILWFVQGGVKSKIALIKKRAILPVNRNFITYTLNFTTLDGH